MYKTRLTCYLRSRVALVELNGAEDFFRDGRGSGEVRPDGVEAVLISSVGERDLLAVRSLEREASFGCYRKTFRTLGARRPTFVR